MKIGYLEIVTKDVEAVCGAYAAAHKVQFSKPVPELGNARTAALPGGGSWECVHRCERMRRRWCGPTRMTNRTFPLAEGMFPLTKGNFPLAKGNVRFQKGIFPLAKGNFRLRKGNFPL